MPTLTPEMLPDDIERDFSFEEELLSDGAVTELEALGETNAEHAALPSDPEAAARFDESMNILAGAERVSPNVERSKRVGLWCDTDWTYAR